MSEIDFQHIAPKCGGKREAFEELCCQLAHRTLPADATYVRLRGAGGDGGVECFADLPDGSRAGWQAKYVDNIDSLISQATKSLETALKVPHKLTRYVVCFPFDLTGPTGRPGKSGHEKFEEWRKKHESEATGEGRKLTIEAWPAFRLTELLVDKDVSGGMRAFFFDATILSPKWFSTHLESAKATAGPRYTPELNVETDLGKWFAAFGRTTVWSHALETKLDACRGTCDELMAAVSRTTPDQVFPAWPEGSRKKAQSLADEMQALLDTCSSLIATDDHGLHTQCITRLDDLLGRLRTLESQLAGELETQHGQGKADSVGFRQFMAENEVSFPMLNLDCVRDAFTECTDLRDWLRSPAGSLAFQQVFVLTGAAGAGKTHGVCDAANHRFTEGLLTCVTFGHIFGGEPDLWTRLQESLGLPLSLGRDGLLDTLNAAAEASGSPLILCIDAINETRPLRYWRDRLAAVVQAVRTRPCLRLCITCRSSFLPYCLPEDHNLPVVEHRGFAGMEQVACQAFFEHYGLRPLVTPILQPELANPLYLRLVCKTLRARGLDRLPAGWVGLAPVIRAFLEEKEKEFAKEHDTSVGASIVSGSLRAIARAIAGAGESVLSWSQAQETVSQVLPQATVLRVLEWLVRADLLIEDAATTNGPFSEEGVIRPAFERLGDFLIASELLDRVTPANLSTAVQPGGLIYPLLKDLQAVEENAGVLRALSILIPELVQGTELPNLINTEPVHSCLLELTVRSFPWREPQTFSLISRSLMLEAFRKTGFFWDAMDSLLSVSAHASTIDAIWLDEFLKSTPLAKRDAMWCGYLHKQHESLGPVRRLIEAAFDVPLGQIEPEIAERWATVLGWFTAAADRRVKDRATRALVLLLAAHPPVIVKVLGLLLDSDDDEVRERALLSCYGALIISRRSDVAREVAESLHRMFSDNPLAFDNAQIRDHIRCIYELANALNVLPDGCDPESTMRPLGTEWPLVLPSDEEIERWKDLPKLAYSCLDDDFFRYSMGCLRLWEDSIPKQNIGKWILRTVTKDLGYEGSGAERYDGYMLGKYGGGRGKPTWAERIGKKYQWVAMYRLASRLWDHAERKHDTWAPKPLRTPLILLEERKLDPTLPANVAGHESGMESWWINSSADFRSGEHLPDAEWVRRQDDLPELKELLSPVEREGQRWLLLAASPSWGKARKGMRRNDPYRHVWIILESYLVPKESVEAAYGSLVKRNFFGRWMPEGATWSHGFAGEYPWATPFNTKPDEWYGHGGQADKLPTPFVPSFNNLAVEWEYDASLPQRPHMIVPAKAFFTPKDLWWDSRDGYQSIGGKTVFRDPSVTEGGHGALIADADELLERLDKLGFSLLWTLLGEKLIVGDRHDQQSPRRTFSQIARLKKDGSLEISEQVIFENYDQDTGPTMQATTH